MNDFLILFIVLSVVNVVIQTAKTIVTVKCGIWASALVNMVAFGIYTYVLFYISADGLNLHIKALITALTNFVGVAIVKLIEQKATKDKLWKIEFTVPADKSIDLHHKLKELDISHSYAQYGKHTRFDCYCETRAESQEIKDLIKLYNAKYFVNEGKAL